MKKLLCLIISICIILGIIPFAERLGDLTPSVSIEEFTAQVQKINQEYKDEPVSNTIIVKSEYNIPTLDSVAIAEGYNDLHIVQFDNSQSASKALAYYEKQKLIDYAEADMTVSTCETTGITYDNHLSWGSESIGIDDYIDYLGDVSTLPEIVVGIIDTGIDLDHEFLQDRIIPTDFNVSDSGSLDSEDDDNGHGTHVAGIVVDNTTNNVKVKAYKCLDTNGSGNLSDVILGLHKAIEDNVNVINMSLGGKSSSELFENIIDTASEMGIVVCVSAGNSGADAVNYSPANVQSAITVAAIDIDDTFPYWTNWGDCIDIIAPGVSIYSSYNDGNYKSLSGTSMACPFVAATCALIKSKDISITVDEIVAIINENGRECNPPTKLKNKRALYIGTITEYDKERTQTPQFSIKGGSYVDKITVELQCDDENSEIYYTTNGVRATQLTGTLYTGPIEVDKVTEIRAVAYSPDKLKSLESVEYYYVLYQDSESNFTINTNGLITNYSGDNQYLIVPDKIKGITVTGIGKYVFEKSNIVRIKFPDSLTYIGEGAFYNNKYLTTVYANNITYIASYGFSRCVSLVNIDISKVEYLENHAFYDDLKLESATNDKLTIISESCFERCRDLISVNLPNVKEIEKSAFYRCISLESANIENVETIGTGAFQDCYKIQEYYLPNLTTIGNGTFYGNVSIKEICLPKLKDVLPFRAFGNCKRLETIYIPHVKTIGNLVFDNCYSLKNLFCPELESTSIISANNVALYLSYHFNECTDESDDSYNYTIIAPSGSYAEQWANDNGHTFLDSESCSFTENSGGEFVYTCSSNDEVCTMPIDLVEQMWYDYLPINNTPDFIAHGFLLDTVPDGHINAKDYARINNRI